MNITFSITKTSTCAHVSPSPASGSLSALRQAPFMPHKGKVDAIPATFVGIFLACCASSFGTPLRFVGVVAVRGEVLCGRDDAMRRTDDPNRGGLTHCCDPTNDALQRNSSLGNGTKSLYEENFALPSKNFRKCHGSTSK